MSRSVTSSYKEKQRYKKQGPNGIKLNDNLNADQDLQSLINSNRIEICSLNRLKDSFYNATCEDLAKRLLGKILVRRIIDGTVLKSLAVETECYPGDEDKASCTYNGRITVTIKAVNMKPGRAFVYVTYGMYHCINISSEGLYQYENICTLFHSSNLQKEESSSNSVYIILGCMPPVIKNISFVNVTPYSEVLLEKQMPTPLFKKFSTFHRTQSFTTTFKRTYNLSQSLAGLMQSTSHFLNIHFNIILPSISVPFKRSFPFRFPHETPVYISQLHLACTMSHLSYPDYLVS